MNVFHKLEKNRFYYEILISNIEIKCKEEKNRCLFRKNTTKIFKFSELQ